MENIKSYNPAINDDSVCNRHALALAISAVASKDASLHARIDTPTDVVEMSDEFITALFNPVDVPCRTLIYFQLECPENIDLIHEIESLAFVRWSTVQITKPAASYLPVSVFACADSLRTAKHIASLFLNPGDKARFASYSDDQRPVKGGFVITDLDKELAKQFALSCKHLASASNQCLCSNFERDWQHYMYSRRALMQYFV